MLGRLDIAVLPSASKRVGPGRVPVSSCHFTLRCRNHVHERRASWSARGSQTVAGFIAKFFEVLIGVIRFLAELAERVARIVRCRLQTIERFLCALAEFLQLLVVDLDLDFLDNVVVGHGTTSVSVMPVAAGELLSPPTGCRCCLRSTADWDRSRCCLIVTSRGR